MSNPGVLAAIAIAVAACSDSTDRNEPAPPPAPPPVVVRTDPASVAECPYGGSVVKSGFDANHNGVLDDAEVANRTVLCDDPPAAPPPPLVVRLVAEPAGAHCTLDGTAVQSGHDRNRNGRLDDDELEHVDYVCGVPLLTRLAAEPPGPRCIAGGVAFLVGRDRNRDGQLGDDEVEQTELTCGDELARDVAIQSAADAAALANIAVIDGSLTVDGTELAELALSRLVQVRGALRIANNAALANVALPALQGVDGALALERDGALAAIALPQLHRSGGLSIAGTALTDLGGLPALTRVTGSVQISGNVALGSADLPVVQVDGDVAIEDNPRLAGVTWRFIQQLGAVRIAANAVLQQVDLPAESAGAVTIASNDQLGQLLLTLGQCAAIAIEDNPALTDVTLAVGSSIGGVLLRGNGPLSLTLPGNPDFDRLIRGSLTLSGPVTKLDSGSPLIVTGDVTFDATRLTSLLQHNQGIEAVGSLHLTGNPQLTRASSVLFGGSLDVRDNAALTELAVEAGQVLAEDVLRVDEIDGDVTIADNPLLQTAPVLDPIVRIRGDVHVVRNPALTRVFGASLFQIDGALVLDGNDSLAAPGIAHLVRAGSIELAHCGAVTALDLPALSGVDGEIDVRANAALLHLRLPALHQADLGVFDNPHLPACEVEALFAAMAGDHHQSGNDDTAVCGP